MENVAEKPVVAEEPVQAFSSDVPAFRRKHFQRIVYHADGASDRERRKSEVEALERKRAAVLLAREREEEEARLRNLELAEKRAQKLLEDERARAELERQRAEAEAKRNLPADDLAGSHQPDMLPTIVADVGTPGRAQSHTQSLVADAELVQSVAPTCSDDGSHDAEDAALRQRIFMHHSQLLEAMQQTNTFDKALHQRLRNDMRRDFNACVKHLDDKIRVTRMHWASSKRSTRFQNELQQLMRQRDRYAKYLQSDDAAMNRLHQLHSNSNNGFSKGVCSHRPYEQRAGKPFGQQRVLSDDGDSLFSFDADPTNYRIGAHAMEMSSEGSISERGTSSQPRLAQQRLNMMAAIKSDARRVSATARQDKLAARPPFSTRPHMVNSVRNRPQVQIRNPMVVGRVDTIELGRGVVADMKFACGESMTLDITIDSAPESGGSPERPRLGQQRDLAKTIVKIADAANRQIQGLHIDTNKL